MFRAEKVRCKGTCVTNLSFIFLAQSPLGCLDEKIFCIKDLRVAGKKTYVFRRKVNGKSIMPAVGNFADFKDIKEAREKARTMA